MCRNIRPLFNFEPPAYPDEVHEAALQYVRKISGMTKPSLANQAAFDAAVADIEERLLTAGEREVSTQQLGELVMRELKKLDKVAYIRFASVYRNFEDVDAFSRAIKEVSPEPRKK